MLNQTAINIDFKTTSITRYIFNNVDWLIHTSITVSII